MLGFFFPWAGALYNGKLIAAMFFVVLNFPFFILSFVGIGVLLLLLFGFYGAFQSYNWAKNTNEKGFGRLIQQQRKAIT